ncbi:MAG: 2-hydroxyacyl-CoA dehydratase family protein [Halanaerobiaceae bacterium]
MKIKKQRPRKIYLNCKYIPPELFAAAGFIPFRPWSEKIGEFGRDLLPYDFCPYTRSFLSTVIENSDQDRNYTVFAASCDGMRRAYDATEKSIIIDVPRYLTEDKTDYYYRQLCKILKELDIDYNKSWYKEKLFNMIIKYNQQRRLLQKLRIQLSLPKEKSFFLLLKAIKNYYFQHKVEEIKVLTENVSSATEKNNVSKAHTGSHFCIPRILISSSCLLDSSVIELIDNKKLKIVGLDSCFGERTFNFQVNTNKEDPLYCLARDYMRGPLCPRMMNPDRRLQEVNKMVETREIDGIIYFTPKFCDQASYDFKLLHDSKLLDIPLLKLEGEYRAGDSGQINTRITAFAEALMINKKGI